MGVSENADCLSIIVSEETGNVSLAQNGIISENLSKEKVKEIIYDAFDIGKNTASRRHLFKKGETK